MGDDDKPFACTAEGCGMRFTNEDHLTVHKKKHEMSLNLSTANSIKNNSNLFVGSFCDSDQTPTPTRFIRNCEEVGLFQDLNPFEEQFRKAVELVKSGATAIPEALNGSSDADVLNTPSVLPNMLESDLVVSTTTTTDSREIQPTPRTLSSQIPSSSIQPSSTTTDSDDEVTVVSTSVSVVQPPSSSSTITTTSNFLPSQTRVIRCGQTADKPMVTQSPVISTATSNAGQIVQIPTVASTGDIPLTVSLPTTSVAQPTPVITNATAVVQLLLKLTDGRSIPVQIPAVSVVPTAVTTTPKAASSVTNSSISSLAKMKLKQALTQNQQISNNNNSNSTATTTTTNNNMRQMLEAVDMVTNQQMKTENKEIPSSPDSKSPVFSKRRRTSEEDPDEKRQRFLERNRAAATRCRLKRKQWIQSLEKKADELTSTNQQLQGEVQLLRNEVAKLKTMLLAHKDCPVTLQQRALGQINEESRQNPIVVDEITAIQITSDEAIASSALTNMAHHTATSEPTHILPVDVIIESDPLDLVNHVQENSNNDVDK